ncbi:jg14148, partial [Pararge aegeria aegeria]
LVYKPGTWLDGSPTLLTGDGDGTVNLRSLNACERWAKRRFGFSLNKRPLKSVPLAGAEHLKILHDPRVTDYITTVMKHD